MLPIKLGLDILELSSIDRINLISSCIFTKTCIIFHGLTDLVRERTLVFFVSLVQTRQSASISCNNCEAMHGGCVIKCLH